MWLALAMAAAVIGALSGGGAMLALPILLAGGATHDEAVVRSLVLVGTASTVTALAHARAGRIDTGVALRFGLVGATSAFVVGRLSHGWPVALGAAVFGALGVMAAIDLGRCRSAPSEARVGRELAMAAGVGALSGWIGAGGGFLLVPLLARRAPFERALGTASAVLAAQALAGLVGHRELDLASLPLAHDVAAGALGAGVGLLVASRVPVARLRTGVAALTGVLAVVVAAREGMALVALAIGMGPTLVRWLARRGASTPAGTAPPPCTDRGARPAEAFR